MKNPRHFTTQSSYCVCRVNGRVGLFHSPASVVAYGVGLHAATLKRQLMEGRYIPEIPYLDLMHIREQRSGLERVRWTDPWSWMCISGCSISEREYLELLRGREG